MTIEEALEWADRANGITEHGEVIKVLAAEVRTLRAQLAEAQKRAEAVEKEFADHKQAFHPDWDQVEAAKSSIREHMAITKAAVERAEAAEERVRELEEAAREFHDSGLIQGLRLELAEEKEKRWMYEKVAKEQLEETNSLKSQLAEYIVKKSVVQEREDRIKELEEANINLHTLMVSAEQRATVKSDACWQEKISRYADLEKAARVECEQHREGCGCTLCKRVAALDKEETK